jgi:hypothetical protein
MKFLATLIISSVFLNLAYSQNNTGRRLDAGVTNSPSGLELATEKKKRSNGEEDLSESDSGVQRPISLKSGGFSANFAYKSDLTYQDNPYAQDGGSLDFASALWTNSFTSSFGLGIIDMGDSILTPYVGGSWTTNEYTSAFVDATSKQKGIFDKQSFNSTNAFIALLSQYGNGWSYSGIISYNMTKLTIDDTEVLRDFTYSLKVLKSFSIDENQFVWDASFNIHSTDGDSQLNYQGRDEMDRFDIASSIKIIRELGPIDVSPKYTLQYSDYSNGDNDDRTQFLHNLSLNFNYKLTDSFHLEMNTAYTINDSSGSDNDDDYEMFDAGAAIKLSARF